MHAARNEGHDLCKRVNDELESMAAHYVDSSIGEGECMQWADGGMDEPGSSINHHPSLGETASDGDAFTPNLPYSVD